MRMKSIEQDCRFQQLITVVEEGNYRRSLPPSLVAVSSQEGRKLFREALSNGGMENYFPLIEQFYTQAEPSFCGISTLVMVLNALVVDPGRIWQGSWRWYNEELADCCDQLPTIRAQGISLEQLAMLGRCNGLEIDTCHQEESSLDVFRRTAKEVSESPQGCHIIVSYARKTVDQTGGGHFSPIGGYHEERDLVLVLDVARFKYPPHWVSLSLLWKAMAEVDKATGKSRGYMLCRKRTI
jgi:glutathione gamma-glutamylcysteinyltransferase